MPTNAYFWEGDRLVIMPDIGWCHFRIEHTFHPVRSRFDPDPDFEKYVVGPSRTDAEIGVAFGEVFVGGRRAEQPEIGSGGPLAVFHPNGRVDRLSLAILTAAEHLAPTAHRHHPERPWTTKLRFRSSGRPTAAG